MIAAELAFAMAVAAYAGATILYFAYLTRPASATGTSRWASGLLGAALAPHLGYIVMASLVLHVCPVTTAHFVVSVAALVAGAVYTVLRRRYRIDALGAFVAPAALTFVLGSRFAGAPERTIPSGYLAMHVTVNILGEALFLLASGAAVLYLVLDHELKQRKRGGMLRRLPPLDALDRAEHRFLLIGFPLLTLGIVTGTAWARRFEVGGASEIFRAGFAYATWVLFAGVLLMRALAGWRGRKAAWGTLVGFAFALAVLVVYLLRTSRPGAS